MSNNISYAIPCHTVAFGRKSHENTVHGTEQNAVLFRIWFHCFMFKVIKNITLLASSVNSVPLFLRITADLRVLHTNGSKEKRNL